MNPQRTQPDPATFRGLRVGVVGLGIEGADIVRFLHAEGAAEIIVSDRKPEAQLARQQAALAGIPYQLEAGNNNAALAGHVDALVVSQGVPDGLPLLESARQRGLPMTSMVRLFMQRCPAPVIGITGSAGKTTTTILVGAMLRAAAQPVVVGGNIGTGLLSTLGAIRPDTAVVLEISHTQLLHSDRSPHIAAVLNVTPNHLDQFDWDAYVDLKRNLVRYQSAADVVILPTENDTARGLAGDTPARPVWFGLQVDATPAATVRDGRIVWNDGTAVMEIADTTSVQIPGEHNLRNVLAAVAICTTWGLESPPIARAIAEFRGVPHRLETVGVQDGVRFVNDSIATTPERTAAALRALEPTFVLLLGGREKQLSLDPLAEAALGRTRAVVCFGEAGPAFAAHLRSAWQDQTNAPAISEHPDLAAALAAARTLAQPGDTVLLSPSGTSFDAYENFEQRGAEFVALVGEQKSNETLEANRGTR